MLRAAETQGNPGTHAVCEAKCVAMSRRAVEIELYFRWMLDTDGRIGIFVHYCHCEHCLACGRSMLTGVSPAPTYAWCQIVREDQVAVYHCISRCVRRAFLCGMDPYSGHDYSHRKGWILDRLRELAGLFAIEDESFAPTSARRFRITSLRSWTDWG